MAMTIIKIATLLHVAYADVLTEALRDIVKECCADLRRDFDQLTRERDEARRVARELALTSRYAEGVWIDAEHAIDALVRYEAAEQIALAYHDTTKKE